jgi:hypothetical protein
VSQRLITPSKITAWLECPHYLTLDSRVAAGILIRPDSIIGSYGQLLRDKSEVHEKACLGCVRRRAKRGPSRQPIRPQAPRMGLPERPEISVTSDYDSATGHSTGVSDDLSVPIRPVGRSSAVPPIHRIPDHADRVAPHWSQAILAGPKLRPIASQHPGPRLRGKGWIQGAALYGTCRRAHRPGRVANEYRRERPLRMGPYSGGGGCRH